MQEAAELEAELEAAKAAEAAAVHAAEEAAAEKAAREGEKGKLQWVRTRDAVAVAANVSSAAREAAERKADTHMPIDFLHMPIDFLQTLTCQTLTCPLTSFEPFASVDC